MTAIVPTIDIVENPQAHGYDGYIDNILIRLAVRPNATLQDITAEAQAQRVDTSESAEDIRDEVGTRYSRSDLSGGAGLDFLHERGRPDDAPLRYWDSRGVDVFNTNRGEIYDARLTNRVDQIQAETGVHSVIAIDGTVYYADATEVRDSANVLQYTGTGIDKMVAMGNSAYILDSSGVGRLDPDTPPWSRVSVSTDAAYTEIWPVKSRIVAAKANVLHDATTDSVLLTLPANDQINDVIDAGPAVIVLATDGVHFLHLDQSLALVPAGESSFADERPVLGVETFGVIGLATVEATEAGGTVCRFYTAQLGVSGNYSLENLQLVYQVGDRATTTDLTPTAIYASRDSIYLAVREEGEVNITLWRYYLPTAGYARSLEVADDGGFDGSTEYVAGMVEVDDRMYFAVSNEGLWKQTDEYVVSGYIVGPLADAYTSEPKQWVAADLSGAKLVTGTALELYDTTDPALIADPNSSSWTLVTKLGVGQNRAWVSSLSGREARYHGARVVLRSDSSRTETPKFRSYSFRGLPASDRDLLLRIPINVSDQIESPGRRATRIPGRGNALNAALRQLEGKHVLIELYRPVVQVRGLIERFESNLSVIPPRGSVRDVLYAVVRGTLLEDSEGVVTQTSGASLGQDILGTVPIGTGDPTT